MKSIWPFLLFVHKFKFNTFFSCTLWWCFLELWCFLIRLGCVVMYKILPLIRTWQKLTDVMAYKWTLLETENRTKPIKIVVAKSWIYFCFFGWFLESCDCDLSPFIWRMKFNLHSTFSRLSRYISDLIFTNQGLCLPLLFLLFE